MRQAKPRKTTLYVPLFVRLSFKSLCVFEPEQVQQTRKGPAESDAQTEEGQQNMGDMKGDGPTVGRFNRDGRMK